MAVCRVHKETRAIVVRARLNLCVWVCVHNQTAAMLSSGMQIWNNMTKKYRIYLQRKCKTTHWCHHIYFLLRCNCFILTKQEQTAVLHIIMSILTLPAPKNCKRFHLFSCWANNNLFTIFKAIIIFIFYLYFFKSLHPKTAALITCFRITTQTVSFI